MIFNLMKMQMTAALAAQSSEAQRVATERVLGVESQAHQEVAAARHVAAMNEGARLEAARLEHEPRELAARLNIAAQELRTERSEVAAAFAAVQGSRLRAETLEQEARSELRDAAQARDRAEAQTEDAVVRVQLGKAFVCICSHCLISCCCQRGGAAGCGNHRS